MLGVVLLIFAGAALSWATDLSPPVVKAIPIPELVITDPVKTQIEKDLSFEFGFHFTKDARPASDALLPQSGDQGRMYLVSAGDEYKDCTINSVALFRERRSWCHSVDLFPCHSLFSTKLFRPITGFVQRE